MERVVYILGAGFSAPLGLPLVRDFLLRGKDLYFGDPKRYVHFEKVIQAVDRLASVKNYLHADLFDIEEVFSIFEMQRQLGADVPDVARFISDVINAYTPEIPPLDPTRGIRGVWGNSEIWTPYGIFAAALAQVQYTLKDGADRWSLPPLDRRYDIITLNYDRSVEDPLERLVAISGTKNQSVYSRSNAVHPDPRTRLMIMKLHGDASQGTLVPPTWHKSIRSEVELDWRDAHAALSDANHVRILGYSFPPTDTYFRYFLKASLARTRHLKSIDIVTLDPEDETARRCHEMFSYKFMRFKGGRTEQYLKYAMDMDSIEKGHECFME